MGLRGPQADPSCRRGHDTRERGGRTKAGACRACVREQGKVKRAERRRYIQALKLERGCAVCGYAENAVALQFHHTDPETKCLNVGRVSESGTMTKLLAEIEKCIVLCANCHAVETWGRKG